MTPERAIIELAYILCFDGNKRITELESVILTDPGYSFYYAQNIIKGRWLEAEAIIRQDDYCWELYCDHFNIKEKYNWKIGL